MTETTTHDTTSSVSMRGVVMRCAAGIAQNHLSALASIVGRLRDEVRAAGRADPDGGTLLGWAEELDLIGDLCADQSQNLFSALNLGKEHDAPRGREAS
jgi:hypothetical protein